MRYIFIDVDGVLNHRGTKAKFGKWTGIDEENLAVLRKLYDLLCDKYGKDNLMIILSSTWRYDEDENFVKTTNGVNRKYVDSMLGTVGLKTDDFTPIISDVYRGLEIATYLASRLDDCEGYLVLDDNAFLDFQTYATNRHFVQTSDKKHGLEPKHFKHALAAIDKPLLEHEIRRIQSVIS